MMDPWEWYIFLPTWKTNKNQPFMWLDLPFAWIPMGVVLVDDLWVVFLVWTKFLVTAEGTLHLQMEGEGDIVWVFGSRRFFEGSQLGKMMLKTYSNHQTIASLFRNDWIDERVLFNTFVWGADCLSFLKHVSVMRTKPVNTTVEHVSGHLKNMRFAHICYTGFQSFQLSTSNPTSSNTNPIYIYIQ